MFSFHFKWNAKDIVQYSKMLDASTVWVQPTCLGQSSLNELASSSFQSQHAIPWAVTLACGTRWNWRRWKERSKAIWPCVKSSSKRAIRPFWEKHKWELQEVQSKEIERNTVRVWESEREKRNIFFAQVTYKEDKLVEFSWSFWVLQP